VSNTSEVSVDPIPDQVTTALYLLGLQSFFGAFSRALQTNWVYLPQAQVRTACFAILSALFLYGLYRRQNWLRWMTVAYTALQVLAMPVVLPKIHDAAQLVLSCTAIILGVAASVLLCLPKARQWYG
jgi:hypothetical protein